MMGKRWLAGLLSLLVPGLGQIVCTSRATRGAFILATVLIVETSTPSGSASIPSASTARRPSTA